MAEAEVTNTEFTLIIVSPDKVVYEGKVQRVIAPGPEQDMAILPDHTPLYAEVVKGDIEVTEANGTVKTIPVESGIMRVKQNKASVILGFKE